jgi:anthranilate synthase component 1
MWGNLHARAWVMMPTSQSNAACAQVRAMQIIDALERAKRGPYGGGIGHVSFAGGMDMALALRTMVIPTAPADDSLFEYGQDRRRREWVVHLQAGAGLVADSVSAQRAY